MKLGRYEKGVILTGISVAIILLIIIALDGIKNINKIGKTEEQQKVQYTTKIGNAEYSIDNSVTNVPNTPVLSAGMIPIKREEDNWVITKQSDNNWYNYQNGKPAYIMLNDGVYQSELTVDMANKKLASENIGQVVKEEELGSIYMWCPRFIYNDQGEIIYIKQEYAVVGSWTMPQMFIYNTATVDFSLSGVWLEKTPLTNATEVTNKINNMSVEDNLYGFIANTKSTGVYVNYNRIGIEKYANYLDTKSADKSEDVLNNLANINRTILQIVNENKKETIRGETHYDETVGKVKIEVTYSKNGISKILDEEGNILSENSLIADSGDAIIGNSTYKYIIIDKEGIQKEIQVTVSGLDVYIIKDQNTLYAFRNAVNAGKTTQKTRAYQVADVALNEGKYTKNQTTGVCTFASDAEQWIPIGNYGTNTSLSYAGRYYGGNHTVSGLYLNNASKDYVGFFGAVTGKVQDLGIIDTNFRGRNYTSGLVGYLTGNCSINNCYSSATISGTGYCGGVVGEIVTTSYLVTIDRCYNTGVVTGSSDYIGGVIGYNVGNSKLNITNCHNIGKITGSADKVGGIIGTEESNAGLTIDKCYNAGIITGKGSVGGIVANILGKTESLVKNCYNTGEIICTNTESSSNKATGGIIGKGNSKISITNCYNSGKVTSKSDYTGGIVGYQAKINYCYNKGNISGIGYVGGIAGYNWSSTEANYCYNDGDINGTGSYIGGIAGTQYTAIQNIYNKGNVTGSNDVGGICGAAYNNVTYAYNLGENTTLTANDGAIYVGGIVGDGNGSCNISRCYNLSKVSGGNNTGGIVGTIAGTSRSVLWSYNLGEVVGSNAGSYPSAGGIAGGAYLTVPIHCCINIGNVSGGTYLGSIFGMATRNSSVPLGIAGCGYLKGTAGQEIGYWNRDYRKYSI